MRKFFKINMGDRFGLLIVIKNLGRQTDRNGKTENVYLCKCDCGNEVKVGHNHLRSGNNKSCGCLLSKTLYKRNFKHGWSHHPLYETWRNILIRCYCKTYNCYHRYGGRGIEIYPEWRNDVGRFIEYCMGLPNWDKKGYSLDRINNDGNYEPGNIQFATKHIQTMNKSFIPKNKYIGVRLELGTAKFYSRIVVNHKCISLGWFNTQEEAVIARNNYIINNNLTEYKIQVIKN